MPFICKNCGAKNKAAFSLLAASSLYHFVNFSAHLVEVDDDQVFLAVIEGVEVHPV